LDQARELAKAKKAGKRNVSAQKKNSGEPTEHVRQSSRPCRARLRRLAIAALCSAGVPAAATGPCNGASATERKAAQANAIGAQPQIRAEIAGAEAKSNAHKPSGRNAASRATTPRRQ
jgi:hypothetical protein